MKQIFYCWLKKKRQKLRDLNLIFDDTQLHVELSFQNHTELTFLKISLLSIFGTVLSNWCEGLTILAYILIHRDSESNFLWFQDLWKLFGTESYHLHMSLRTLKRCMSARAPVICGCLTLKHCILMDFCFLAVEENCY